MPAEQNYGPTVTNTGLELPVGRVVTMLSSEVRRMETLFEVRLVVKTLELSEDEAIQEGDSPTGTVLVMLKFRELMMLTLFDTELTT